MSFYGHNLNAEAFDRDYHLHPFTDLKSLASSGPLMIERGQGTRLWDNKGKEYIDGLAGLWCVNIGYGRSEIAEAISRQAKALPYCQAFAGMTSTPPALLSERIVNMAPVNMKRIFFGTSGSDANDTAVKIVWYYNNARRQPKKKKILARSRAYHGVTVASASLTGLEGVHKAFDLPAFDVVRLSAPHYYWAKGDGVSEEEFVDRLIAELEETIEREGAETIAAFISEPIMGAGGVIVPPDGYFRRVQEILKANDILFVADEVICGFGRLGKMFGSQVFDLRPDIITIAKGITSGYQPLSGCMVNADVYKGLESGSSEIGFFGHGYTYSAHPIPAAAALANLDILERENLVKNAADAGSHMQAQLKSRAGSHPLVGDVRGHGLIGAVELSASKDRHVPFAPAMGVAKSVYAEALNQGLITRALQGGDILAFSPPLTITNSEIDEIVDKLVSALNVVADKLARNDSTPWERPNVT